MLEIIYYYYKSLINLEIIKKKSSATPNNHVTSSEHILGYVNAIDFFLIWKILVYDEFSI